MGMGLSTKAKSSGSCESDRIEEEKNFSQVSDEDTVCVTQTMIQTQKRQKAARPAGRQNAIEYREEYIDGDGDDETKLEEIPCSYCTKIVQSSAAVNTHILS